jgi:3-dehydroquinate synthase
MESPIRVVVDAERPYEVIIGRDLVGELDGLLGEAGQVAIIHPGVLAPRAAVLAEVLQETGRRATLVEVPDAERAKTVEVLASCWATLGQRGFTRSDAVVGLGGGAATDLSGFVAATWMRGITSVLLPTTLLGMVDAAIGGKTGINAAAGKNLIGAFHSPAGVICDLESLSGLPRDDLAAGMAEVVKVGFTSDPSILHDVIEDVDGCLDPQGPLIADLIRRAVQVKADVVAGDFREQVRGSSVNFSGVQQAGAGEGGTGVSGGSKGLSVGREVLNYGHTFGHAVEHVEDYRWRHGAAVSVGLVYVAELARIGGYLPDADADVHRQVLQLLGLPTSYPAGRWDGLHAAMAMDKKARGTLLRFIILRGIGEPMNLDGPPQTLLQAAYAAVSTD